MRYIERYRTELVRLGSLISLLLAMFLQAANPYVIKLSVLDDEIALHVS